MAQRFTELRKNVTVEELQEQLDEIVDDLDANPGTVYHVVDEQGRRFVLISKQHYDALASVEKGSPETEVESAITLSDPSEMSQT
ncbi:hypothetical protein [Rhizobium sp. MHM7A]|uniref:hypothetical protein n=1 Tax=Rhizobium sp. MHM7A TaxID=2583233 RepID=UPI001106547E|nr:hypothetical protein [Rhizobium sp. MHM7A]TLX16424.1 hypothetical protein FFR93_03565 [Rhizobium sp. MHM7A]